MPAAAQAPGLGLTRVAVKPNLYLVVGVGANSVLLVTKDGVAVVGAKESEAAGRELREVIAGVTNQPVRYLIEPNHQARSTHGATMFSRATDIIAQERARQWMLAPPEGSFWTGLAAASLPNITVGDRATFYLGDTRIEVIHPGRGQTDGDVIVWFPDQQTVHMGDLFWNHRLPFIDERHGGSATALITTLQRVLALPGVRTFIPGYGDVGTRADVLRQVALLRDLEAQVRGQIAQRHTRSQTIDAIPIPTYARSDPAERFRQLVGAIYDDLSGARASHAALTPTLTRKHSE